MDNVRLICGGVVLKDGLTSIPPKGTAIPINDRVKAEMTEKLKVHLGKIRSYTVDKKEEDSFVKIFLADTLYTYGHSYNLESNTIDIQTATYDPTNIREYGFERFNVRSGIQRLH